MTPSEFYKHHGAQSIQDVSERSGVPINTLRDWVETRPNAARMLAERCGMDDSIEMLQSVQYAVDGVKEAIDRLQEIIK